MKLASSLGLAVAIALLAAFAEAIPRRVPSPIPDVNCGPYLFTCGSPEVQCKWLLEVTCGGTPCICHVVFKIDCQSASSDLYTAVPCGSSESKGVRLCGATIKPKTGKTWSSATLCTDWEFSHS